MSKITIPLKKYSKSSIDLVEKGFDPNLRGEWKAPWEIEHLFLNTYIQEKFKDILHIVPFTIFTLFYDIPSSTPYMKLIDLKKNIQFIRNRDSYEFYLKKYRDTHKRFTFYPITIHELNEHGFGYTGHAVSALYDKETNKVEIFDSIGSNFSNFKKIVKDLFIEIYRPKVKIIYMVDRCIAFGKLEYEKCKPLRFNYTSEGFCSIWVAWFLELRLSNPNIPKEKLIEKAIKRLKNGNKVCELLRGYAQFVDKVFSRYSIEKTSSSLIIKAKETKKNSEFIKKDYLYLYTFLVAVFGASTAFVLLQNLRKK
jgi:hypothetical protein